MIDNLSEKRRYIAIFFPLLSADRWRRDHPDGLPVVFVEKQRGSMRIVAVDEVAQGLGIAPQMMLADARARVPEIITVDYDAVGDAALLTSLADDAERYTPMVMIEAPDILLLDITGCSHLWGGEAMLAGNFAGQLANLGMTLRLAIADTPDAAMAQARHGGETIKVDRRGGTGHMLHEERALYVPDISARALNLPPATYAALTRAGLHTLGDLAQRPRAPLAARFGADFATRLARVMGEEDRRITPRRVPPAIRVEQRFAEPIARTDDMLATLEDLAEQAAVVLEERRSGGRAFVAALYRSDGDVRRLIVETGAPTRDPALLLRLFRERIDALADPLDPGFGYDLIRLAVPLIEPLAAAQIGLDGARNEDVEVAALVDRLGTRLGRGRLRHFAAGDSHIPEKAGAPYPAPAADDPPSRPLHLFDPPQRIDVIAEIPDGPPRRFRWRRQLHEVTRHEGPERIASEWWMRKDGAGLTRDYYRVEDARGHRFWLFRHGLYGAERVNPDWYLHGTFS